MDAQALVPGFVNAHSHAFHRRLRGKSEIGGQADDFWKWRENMYALVEEATFDKIFEVSSFLPSLVPVLQGDLHGDATSWYHDRGRVPLCPPREGPFRPG